MADSKEGRKPLLSLDTLVERYNVIIDKKPYELRNPAEMSLLDWKRIQTQGARIQALMGALDAGDLDEDQVAELYDQLDRVCRLVLVAPDDVHARLREVHKLEIMNAFTGLLRAEAALVAGDAEEAPIPIPDPTSPIGESTSPV